LKFFLQTKALSVLQKNDFTNKEPNLLTARKELSQSFTELTPLRESVHESE
jgi:hypothetical protein